MPVKSFPKKPLLARPKNFFKFICSLRSQEFQTRKWNFPLTALFTYSPIHKAAVRLAAVQNDLRRSFLPEAPIGSQWTLFCPTGIVPVEIMERPGTVRPAAL